MNATTGITLLIILVVIALTYLMWRSLMRRGFRRVVAIFRAAKATDPKRAHTLEQLGLEGRSGMLRYFGPRDYKQTAMRIMGQDRIILMTEDEKFYLSEEALRVSRVKRFAGLE
jgi:hypothetical protein